MAKKNLVKDSQALSSLIARIEGGKSEIKIGDIRQAIKILRNLDRFATLEGLRSPLTMLRKQVLKDVKGKKK
jgi:predicted transcriptional regulator